MRLFITIIILCLFSCSVEKRELPIYGRSEIIETNIDGIIGANSAAAGTFAAIVGTSLSVSNGNITNVGSIACDSVVIADATVGLDIVFGGNTG